MKVSAVIENILKTSREARNSDRELFIKFMEHFGLYFNDLQRNIFKDMPSLETARRVRQKLQEEGKYLADQVVGKERKFKGLSMQQRNPRSDKIEDVIETPRAISWLTDDN